MHVHVSGLRAKLTTFPRLICDQNGKHKNTQAIYEELLQVLIGHKEALEPTTVVTDFELAAIKAFKVKFPDVVTRGCSFHLCQKIYRHVQAYGLQER